MPDSHSLGLLAITLFAATVNGALGYGFSSLTVPIALLMYANRVLNPALVLVEVAVNTWVLIINRRSVPIVWRRVVPIVVGLFPGVVVGSFILSSVSPGLVKVVTYVALLPLILLQASGLRRPIRAEKAIGAPFGVGLGVLYSVTTISGPPLALLFNNQGLARQDFRAALSLVRIAESSATAVAYYFLGLYSLSSAELLPWIAPSVLIGIPLGAFLIRQIEADVFRRVCMSFDAWIVGFGLSRALEDLNWVHSPYSYGALVVAAGIDAILLYVFFTRRARDKLRTGGPSRIPEPQFGH